MDFLIVILTNEIKSFIKEDNADYQFLKPQDHAFIPIP